MLFCFWSSIIALQAHHWILSLATCIYELFTAASTHYRPSLHVMLYQVGRHTLSSPNVAVGWVAHLLTRQVSCPDLGRETDYPNRHVHGFIQSPKASNEIIQIVTIVSYPLFHNSLYTDHFIIRPCYDVSYFNFTLKEPEINKLKSIVSSRRIL
jgi:hypothetical protein